MAKWVGLIAVMKQMAAFQEVLSPFVHLDTKLYGLFHIHFVNINYMCVGLCHITFKKLRHSWFWWFCCT